jgi:hypothetical protein
MGIDKKFERISVFIYFVAAISLTLMALLIMGWSVYEVLAHVLTVDGLSDGFVSKMLSSVGAIVISVAILDVAKYMIEEVVRSKQLHSPKEAREALTKIMVIISIVVGIEGLIYILKAGTADITLLIYPAILIITSVFLMIGLGVYQKISLQAEKLEQD